MSHVSRYARPALCLAIALTLAATARTALAAPACGTNFLGLEEGVSWSYERQVSEEDEEGDQGEAGELDVDVPTELEIEVISVEEDDDQTIVTLKEQVDDIEQETEIRCGDEDIIMSPHSFFYTGEPGGGIGITLEESDREGASYPKRLRARLSWNEWVEAEFEHASAEESGAEHPAGKIQIEREMNVIRRVPVEIDEESYRPFRVDFKLEGRAMVEPEIDLSVELPAGAAGALWFEPGTGLIRAINLRGHEWKLADYRDGDE